MSKNPSHLEKALALCRQYLKHLESNPDTNPIHSQKKSVVKSLLRAQNPTEIIRLLGVKKFDSKLANYSKILRQSRTSWLNFLLKGFLVFITFPIAIPVLMIWSWRNRGTVNFFKTDGSILVDKLIVLYEGSAKPHKPAKPDKTTTNNLSEINPVKTQLKSSKVTILDPFSSKPTAQPIQATPIIVTQSTTPKLKTFKPVTIKSPTTPSGPVTQPQIKPTMKTMQPGVTQMLMKAEPKAPHAMTSMTKEEAGDYALANIAESIHHAFFSDPEVLLQSDLKKDTGKPIIIASRVRPAVAGQDYFQIDVCCNFKWCLKKPKTLTVMVLTNIDYNPEPSKTEIRSVSVERIETRPLKKSGFPSLASILGTLSLWSPPPTFASLMQQGDEIHGFDEKEAFYWQAYQIASNDSEHIAALEAMVNLLNEYCDHIRNDAYRALCSDIEAYDFKQRPLNEQNKLLRDKALDDRRIQTLEDKINAYLTMLPINYRRQTLSAKAINKKFNEILGHLQNNNAGLAWSTFSTMLRLTPFIKLTFPNLVAMWHQIDGIFQLIDGDGYSILPTYRRVPKDSELRKNRLSVYEQEGQIWCATISHQCEIDRFIIQPHELGRDAEDTLGYLTVKNILEKEFNTVIYRAVGRRGYYPSNEDSGIGASIKAARNMFSRAHQWLERYQQSLREHPPASEMTLASIDARLTSLTHRLQNEAFQPLQHLMQEAEEANQTASMAERRNIAIPKIAKNRKRLVNDDWSKAHLQFYPETWAMLLAHNNTMSVEQWDDFLSEYTYESEKLDDRSAQFS